MAAPAEFAVSPAALQAPLLEEGQGDAAQLGPARCTGQPGGGGLTLSAVADSPRRQLALVGRLRLPAAAPPP